MLFPKKMSQVNIFLRRQDLEQTTLALASFGQIQFAPAGRASAEAPKPWSDLDERYRGQKQKIEKLMNVLEIPARQYMELQQIHPSEDQEIIESRMDEISGPVKEWKENKDRTEDEAKRLDHLAEEMELLAPSETPIENLRRPEFLHLQIGTIPQEYFEHLEVVISGIPFVIFGIATKENRILAAAVSTKEYADVLNRSLESVFFEKLELPRDVEGKPAAVLRRFKDRRKEVQHNLDTLQDRQKELREMYRMELQGLRSKISENLRVIEAIEQFDQVGNTFLITGWVPEERTDDLTSTIMTVTQGKADVEVVEFVMGGRRRVPTAISNPRFLRPFETITTTFGFPAYGELDPTPVVAITFILMYGMMFGDAGHGLVLLLLGLWLYRAKSRAIGNLGAVFAACGGAAVIFGLLYGSVFGNEDWIPAFWLSPLENIPRLLLASVLAGIFLLNVGFALSLVESFRARRWEQMLLEQNGLAGILLYWALIGGSYAVYSNLFSGSTLAATIAIPALVLFFREPLTRLIHRKSFTVENGWGKFSIQSFFELFETVISFISNTLSFVRLGAFAIAHIGLMQVVFLLSRKAGGIGEWIIIIIGTIVVIALEGLIVGIQAMRLEYYEFFSKFFRGRGKAFVPFRMSPESK